MIASSSDLDGFAQMIEASGALLPGSGVLGVAPHSLRAVTPEELAAVISLEEIGPI